VGNVASNTSPFWTCNNGTSTVYAVNATNATPLGIPNAALKPTVPGAGGKQGSCTGIVANIAPATTSPTFPVAAPGKSPVAAGLIFVTEDGVLSAWANGAVPAQAFIHTDNSAGSSYKGLALALTPSVRLFAANFKTGNIDVFDSEFKPVNMPTGSFVDPRVPAGLAPFHIWTINGRFYVAYAKQDAARFFDVRGDGNGYVSVFDTSGRPFQSLVPGGAGSKLNSPWGLAIAPASFGKYANALLVGNFCDGLIDAYDATTGAYLGTLQDPSGANIVLSGLWSIYFGNGANGGDKDTLYFTAGPGGQRRGILGSISANPNVTTSNVVSAGQPSGGISANTFLTIKAPILWPRCARSPPLISSIACFSLRSTESPLPLTANPPLSPTSAPYRLTWLPYRPARERVRQCYRLQRLANQHQCPRHTATRGAVPFPEWCVCRGPTRQQHRRRAHYTRPEQQHARFAWRDDRAVRHRIRRHKPKRHQWRGREFASASCFDTGCLI
jgi:uncharacterized protein (TIGR03118 family)